MSVNPIGYPYPVNSTTPITLADMVKNPTRVTRYLSDLSLRGFIAARIFNTNAGAVTGGGVIYDQLTMNDLFTSRDVQDVLPGTEFPIMSDGMPTPMFAPVEKFGGKFFVTDEDIARDNIGKVQREGRKIINTIIRKTDQKAIALLERSILPSQIITGVNWKNVVTAGTNTTQASGWPAADFAKVRLAEEQTELGVETTLWLVNPAEKAQLSLVYGPAANDVFDAYGIEMISSNRVPAGTAYVVEPGQVGEMRVEKPLSTEQWREQKTQREWFQSDIRPVMYVTNPYSVFKLTGLGG